jgi:ADP-heptose:LPS heptosyltransferase
MIRFISRVRSFLRRRRANKMLAASRRTRKHDTLLLKLDKVGDYILFRNFIEETRKNIHPTGQLIMCGNIVWKELAEKLDGEFVDEFIWVDPAMLEDEKNRIKLYKQLRKTRCNKIIYCAYSRTNEVDYVVLRSGAKEKVAFYGDETNILPVHKKENDARYNLLVPSPAECLFEFNRNKLFFEYIFNTKIQIDKPYIKAKPGTENISNPYIMIFPGAGHEVRRWSTSNFTRLCVALFQSYKLPIHVCGSKNEFHYAEEIVSRDGSFVINDAGKYSLYETIGIIKNAALVITNDSGPLHISLAIDVPVLCISNGNHFERFCPYPSDMNMPLAVVFPDEFESKMKTDESRISLRCKGSEIDINTITADKVLHTLKTSNLIRHD